MILTARTGANAREAANRLPAGSRAVSVALDVTSDGDASALDAAISEHTDRVDVLINNAAIRYDSGERAADPDLRVVREALETNVVGAWRTTLSLLPLIGRSENGRIVNVSSGAGSLSEMASGTPAYRVSKAALNALTRTLAADLRPHRDPGHRRLSRLGSHRRGRARGATGG